MAGVFENCQICHALLQLLDLGSCGMRLAKHATQYTGSCCSERQGFLRHKDV